MEYSNKGPKTMRYPSNPNAGTCAGTAGTEYANSDGSYAISDEIDAYTYLKSIWNNHLEPTHVRMRAAAIGIEFERPKLAVSAIMNDGNDIATLLDQRIQRMKQLSAPIIDQKPATIDQEPFSAPIIDNGNADVAEPSKPAPPNPLSRIYSNRFKRRF